MKKIFSIILAVVGIGAFIPKASADSCYPYYGYRPSYHRVYYDNGGYYSYPRRVIYRDYDDDRYYYHRHHHRPYVGFSFFFR